MSSNGVVSAALSIELDLDSNADLDYYRAVATTPSLENLKTVIYAAVKKIQTDYAAYQARSGAFKHSEAYKSTLNTYYEEAVGLLKTIAPTVSTAPSYTVAKTKLAAINSWRAKALGASKGALLPYCINKDRIACAMQFMVITELVNANITEELDSKTKPADEQGVVVGQLAAFHSALFDLYKRVFPARRKSLNNAGELFNQSVYLVLALFNDNSKANEKFAAIRNYQQTAPHASSTHVNRARNALIITALVFGIMLGVQCLAGGVPFLSALMLANLMSTTSLLQTLTILNVVLPAVAALLTIAVPYSARYFNHKVTPVVRAAQNLMGGDPGIFGGKVVANESVVADSQPAVVAVCNPMQAARV